MREIKCRGYRKDIGWKYGYLTVIDKPLDDNLIAIKPLDEKYITYGVDSDSIGEYIGLKDESGKEIYDGDIVSAIYWSGREFYDWVEEKVVVKVCWRQELLSFIFIEDVRCKPQMFTLSRLEECSFKIIDNTYERQNRLKGG